MLWGQKTAEANPKQAHTELQRVKNPYLKMLEAPLFPSAPQIPDLPSKEKVDKTLHKQDPLLAPEPPEPKREPSEELKERLKQKNDRKYFPQLKRF